MKRKQLKFLVGSVVIILTLTYLGFSGFQASSAYYQTVSELYASKDAAYERRLKVAGDVVPEFPRRRHQRPPGHPGGPDLMRILDRYAVRQLVPVWLWCLCVFLFLSCVIDLFEHLDEILR